MFQTRHNSGTAPTNLQQQKSFICSRHHSLSVNTTIYLQQQKSFICSRPSHSCQSLIYLQQQKSFICSRPGHHRSSIRSIYNSRNLLYVLDFICFGCFCKSTIVEIFYMFQTSSQIQHQFYLQQQKSFICSRRQTGCIMLYEIYNSRNLLYVLDIIQIIEFQ